MVGHMKIIKYFFIKSGKLILLLTLACCSNIAQKQVCGKSLVKANLPNLTSQDIVYYEGYAYGVLLDSVALRKVKYRDTCATCDLYRALTKGKTILPVHLALTALQTPEKGALEHYEFVDGEIMDSMRYVLNNLTWTRPINSYTSGEVIRSLDLINVQEYWSKILLSRGICTRYVKPVRN